jgi:hypothetical protein
MNIELAQELKEAGYPQDLNMFYWIARPGRNYSVIYGIPTGQEKPRIPKGTEFYASPMLSDLIAACGNGFEGLSKLDELQWLAISKVELPDKSPGRIGATPEEAVARLWLALNEKKND